MIDTISFQAKARTVDHLGREQIADCPTAISELWKNSFDAYARNVGLDLYPVGEGVATLWDDGHGMDRADFLERWLVVGTESKASSESTPRSERNGLRERPKLGQKGIGRLSCANLGPTLLLISKRRASPFIISLIDWRLFENPFLNLSDIELPVQEVVRQEDIFAALPALLSKLLNNVTGGDEPERSGRIKKAWSAFDTLSAAQSSPAPSDVLLSSLGSLRFEERHLDNWPLWKGECDHGTAMLVSGLNFDLQVLFDTTLVDSSAQGARARFFETLSSFVDPFASEGVSGTYAADPEFSYSVQVWNDLMPREIVGSNKEFNRRELEGLEHQIDGIIDKNGVFKGRIKTFGKWLEGECIIEPPEDLIIPSRSDTIVGPFGLFIAAMEFELRNTSLPSAEFEHFRQLAEKYSGFMMFRDGLRVLPYGRTDNDFFEIESRRTKHAGREFWNHRQMFGRVAIARSRNPNLRDKAGREGLLDNRSAKVLRELVSNVLRQAARRYFGTASEYRKENLPEIRSAYDARKATAEREKLRLRNSRAFRTRLKVVSETLPLFRNEVEAFASQLQIQNSKDIEPAQERLEAFRERLAEHALTGAPKSLGTMAAKYEAYRSDLRLTKSLIQDAETQVSTAMEQFGPPDPAIYLERQAKRNQRAYSTSLRKRRDAVQEVLKAQLKNTMDLEQGRLTEFESDTDAILKRHDAGQVSFKDASDQLMRLREHSEQISEDLFAPYLRALEILQENIDLDHLITFGINEANELRGEVDRLTQLAQLGIAVEISGHELQDYDDLIADAFRKLPGEVRRLKAVRDIELGVEGLTDQLRFLSPLRLAGQKVRTKIKGDDIAKYVRDFFRLQINGNHIKIEATPAFNRFSIFDFQSRLYPVFINLVNNAIYWVSNSNDQDKRIILDVIGDDVIVSDNGPGVNSEDRSELFTLFFTRKAHGGRGVGLYLTRANLVSGGHSIKYVEDAALMPLKGANFAIKFQGAEFD